MSLKATNATIRQIMTEWQRVGQTRVINCERIPGGPVTLELNDVNEEEALDVLLRSVAGYMAAPRANVTATGSRFDRILVMPTSVPPPAPPPPPAPTRTVTPPVGAQPGVPVMTTPGMPGVAVQRFPPRPPGSDDGSDNQTGQPGPNGVPPRGQVFNPFAPAQTVNPGQPGQPGEPVQQPGTSQPLTYPSFPSVPPGSAPVPGIVVAPPQPPAQPNPAQPQGVPAMLQPAPANPGR